jgi:copper oxidase (laccase) domain-containing protein
MTAQGHPPLNAAIGPGIGPCCFEVGQEVADRFPEDVGETRWGATSVDLTAAIRSELEGMDVWVLGACTMHEESLYSHRRTRTAQRMATVAWVS